LDRKIWVVTIKLWGELSKSTASPAKSEGLSKVPDCLRRRVKGTKVGSHTKIRWEASTKGERASKE